LRKEMYNLEYDEETLNKRIHEFNDRIAALAPKAKSPVKELVLSFSSETETTLQLKVSYLVNGAGWNPLYDIQVENTLAPVELAYKAKVYQNTGMDWKEVKMKLSTVQPGTNQNRPVLRPSIVDFVQYRTQEYKKMSNEISNSAYYVMQKDDAGDAEMGNTVVDSEMFVDFELAGTQTVPTGGREYVFGLAVHTIAANYKYHAVPRLDNAAYLLAMIGNYGQYNLLPGPANVFFGENYVGQVNIQPAVTSDTLMISLGRDERLIVQRSKVKGKCSKKVLSGVQKEVFVYEVIVRNNKSAPLQLEILDQIPVSRRENIKVELLREDGAAYDIASGTLKWTLMLNSGKSKNFTYEYELSYPEKQQVFEQMVP
jgi:uncharacterized protein (TIGR02231 family)